MNGFVDVPGGRLRFADDGNGPPIVLLHAGIANHHAWDAMVPGLTAAGFRAVRYDARGFGESTTEDVDFSNRADLVAILDARGIRRAALVGNSRGGAIAIDATIEHPERVVALVAVGTGISGFEAEATEEETAAYDEMDRLEAAGLADELADLHVRLWVDGPGQSPDRVPASIRETVRSMDAPLYAPGRVNGRPIVLDPPANGRLAELAVPVLAVVGALDASDCLAANRRLEVARPAARSVVVPGVAHMVGMEAPATLIEHIVAFLRGLPAWS